MSCSFCWSERRLSRKLMDEPFKDCPVCVIVPHSVDIRILFPQASRRYTYHFKLFNQSFSEI